MKKVVLVTGASSGFGASLASEFASAGYRVVVNYYRNRESAEHVAEQIANSGGEAICYQADVSNIAEVGLMVKKTLAEWGRLDVLVNNAGITHESLVVWMQEKDWDRVIRTNLRGAYLCCKSVIPRMIKQRSGDIINISSILGVWGGKGESGYAASKAALVGFTKSLAKELGRWGIRVNAVLPGFMLTPMTESLGEQATAEARDDNVLKRFSEPEISARFVVQLAGMETVSGQLFNLDGRIYRWA